MIHINFVLLLFAIATIIFLAIGFLSVKNSSRIYFRIISIVLLLITTMFFIGEYKYNNDRINSFIGLYKLKSSKGINKTDSLKEFDGLLLTVKSDGTFELNKKTNTFISENGSWKYHETEDEGYIECIFSITEISYAVYPYKGDWTFGHNNDTTISFTKISNY